MKEISCEQIDILLSYFIDKKLSNKIMTEIEYHLNICSSCREKYMNMLRIAKNYYDIKQIVCPEEDTNIYSKTYMEKSYKDFQLNLSAYIDNELPDKENLRIKKFAIVNAIARQDLENMISFRQLLQDSFIKTKSNFKRDLSKQTINNINENSRDKHKYEFLQIITKFILLLFCLTLILTLFTVKY